MRIACWSGPRNISTALMRAFASRADCAVVDEPLYAAYLADTGKLHPGRDAILASQDQDWRRVSRWLVSEPPDGKAHWYQKHMAHHLLPDRLEPWLDALVHVFLVRDPAEMLSSLLAVWPEAELEDTGLPQQVGLFERLGATSPVIDGRAVMDAPESTLRELCAAIELPWDPAMLTWDPGPRPEDGIWAEHWYAGVHRSTGFEPWRPRDIQIPDGKRHLLDACSELYQRLKVQD